MKSWISIGLFAWFLPGYAHFTLGHKRRALILGLSVWSLFTIGVLSGGLFYPGFSYEEGPLLSLLNIVARLGNGLGTIIEWLLIQMMPSDTAAWATFEYGGRFIEISGLLNFLAALDAVDLKLGRKE